MQMMQIKYVLSILLVSASIGAWAQPDSLSLDKAVALALKNNYGIISTEKSAAISELNNHWGNTGALPQVSFVGNGSQGWNWNDDDNYTTDNTNASVNLNWTIFRGFGARIQKETLEKLEQQSQGHVAVVVENTLLNVIMAYYNVLLTEKNKETARVGMQLSEDRYIREQERQELGSATTYQLLQAQNAYLQDQSDFLSLQATHRNAVRQLNYLMAAPLENVYVFTSDFVADTTQFSMEILKSRMLDNNHTLQNQYLQLELSRLDVKSAKSAYFPTLSLGASGGWGNSSTEYETMSQLDRQAEGYNSSVNLTLNYSIYGGGQRKRTLEAARIQKAIAQTQTADMELDLTNQLAQELERYRVQKELLRVAEKNRKAAELNLNLSRQKYENGTINSFNFRDVQQIYLNNAYRYQSTLYQLIQSYHQLLRLTGGLVDTY